MIKIDTGDDIPIVKVTSGLLGYGKIAVLRDVNLVVHRGEFHFFLGPNGSGRGTLLKTILGSLDPLVGAVWRDGQFASASAIGFVPQRCNLKPGVRTTLQEFVSLGRWSRNDSPVYRAQALKRALDDVGLYEQRRVDYGLLSGGQRQRGLLGRALIRDPQLLILDEPTNGLDLAAEEEFLALLARLRLERNVTVIFVTHHLALAVRFATTVTLFCNGTIISGSPAALLRQEALKQTFGIAPVTAGVIGGDNDC